MNKTFITEEFIHPAIIEELNGWISDKSETTVAIDLSTSNNSNRYFEKIELRYSGLSDTPWVYYRKDHGYFAYFHIGVSKTGIHMLHCHSNGGGSGIFNSIMFLVIQRDEGINFEDKAPRIKKRVVLKTLGSISLGDRYQGSIFYTDNFLTISKDENPIRHDVLKMDIKIEVR